MTIDLQKELDEIAELKKGNNEIALFCYPGKEPANTSYTLYIGNRSDYAMLGEVLGQIVTRGYSLEDVFKEAKRKLERRK